MVVELHRFNKIQLRLDWLSTWAPGNQVRSLRMSPIFIPSKNMGFSLVGSKQLFEFPEFPHSDGNLSHGGTREGDSELKASRKLSPATGRKKPSVRRDPLTDHPKESFLREPSCPLCLSGVLRYKPVSTSPLLSWQFHITRSDWFRHSEYAIIAHGYFSLGVNVNGEKRRELEHPAGTTGGQNEHDQPALVSAFAGERIRRFLRRRGCA
jgi:hypothetical protein